MNILVAVNDAYVHPLAVMLTSLLHNNKDRRLDIYLMFSDISASNVAKLHRLVGVFDAKLHAIKIGSEFLNQVPTNDFSKETYYRLFAYKFLPAEVERVLFLDPDMIVVGNISKLYDMDMPDGYFFCAVEDVSVGIQESKRRLRIPIEDCYYNSGTLLMDIKKIRQVFDEERIIDYAIKYNNMLYYCDQDCLNVFFRKNILKIDNDYNYEARFHSGKEILLHLLKSVIPRKKSIKIIHYMGADKPWKDGYAGKYLLVFFRYAKMGGVHSLRKYEVKNKLLYFFNVMKSYVKQIS